MRSDKSFFGQPTRNREARGMDLAKRERTNMSSLTLISLKLSQAMKMDQLLILNKVMNERISTEEVDSHEDCLQILGSAHWHSKGKDCWEIFYFMSHAVASF
jgi:hypothetical protein